MPHDAQAPNEHSIFNKQNMLKFKIQFVFCLVLTSLKTKSFDGIWTDISSAQKGEKIKICQ